MPKPTPSKKSSVKKSNIFVRTINKFSNLHAPAKVLVLAVTVGIVGGGGFAVYNSYALLPDGPGAGLSCSSKFSSTLTTKTAQYTQYRITYTTTVKNSKSTTFTYPSSTSLGTFNTTVTGLEKNIGWKNILIDGKTIPAGGSKTYKGDMYVNVPSGSSTAYVKLSLASTTIYRCTGSITVSR